MSLTAPSLLSRRTPGVSVDVQRQPALCFPHVMWPTRRGQAPAADSTEKCGLRGFRHVRVVSRNLVRGHLGMSKLVLEAWASEMGQFEPILFVSARNFLLNLKKILTDLLQARIMRSNLDAPLPLPLRFESAF